MSAFRHFDGPTRERVISRRVAKNLVEEWGAFASHLSTDGQGIIRVATPIGGGGEVRAYFRPKPTALRWWRFVGMDPADFRI